METLPHEVLAKIFEELNAIDLHSVEQVNKQFNDISSATFTKNFENSLSEILALPNTKKGLESSPFEVLDSIQARIRTRIKFIQLKHQIFTSQKLNFTNKNKLKYSEILNQLNISLRDNLTELQNYHKMVTKNGAFFENILELNISSFPFLVDQSLFPSDYKVENFEFIEEEGKDKNTPKSEPKIKKSNKNKRKRKVKDSDEDDGDDDDDDDDDGDDDDEEDEIDNGPKKKKRKIEHSDSEDNDEEVKDEEETQEEDYQNSSKPEPSSNINSSGINSSSVNSSSSSSSSSSGISDEKSEKKEREIKIRISFDYSLADFFDRRENKIGKTESTLFLLFHSNSKKLLNYLRSPFESFLLPVDNAEEKRKLFLFDQNDNLSLAKNNKNDESNEESEDESDDGSDDDDDDEEKNSEEEEEGEDEEEDGRNRMEDDCDDGDYLYKSAKKKAKIEAFLKRYVKKAELNFPNFGNEKEELKYAKKAVRKLKGKRGTVCQVEHEDIHNIIHINPHLGRKLLFLILYQNFDKESKENFNQLIDLKDFIRKIPIQFVFMILLNNFLFNEISKELQEERNDKIEKYISSPISDMIVAFEQKNRISMGDFENDYFHEKDCEMNDQFDDLKEKIFPHFPFLYGEKFISLSLIGKLNQLCDLIDIFRSKNYINRLENFLWDNYYQHFRLYNKINSIEQEIIENNRENEKEFFPLVENPFFKKEFFQSFCKGGGELNFLSFMGSVSHSNLNSSFDLFIPSVDQIMNEKLKEKIHFNMKKSNFEMEKSLDKLSKEFHCFSLSISFENETNWNEFKQYFTKQEGNEKCVDEENKTFYLLEHPSKEATQFFHSFDTLFVSENEKTYQIKMDKWKRNFTALFDFLIKRFGSIYAKEEVEKYSAVSPIMKSFYLAQFIEIVSSAFSSHFLFSNGD